AGIRFVDPELRNHFTLSFTRQCHSGINTPRLVLIVLYGYRITQAKLWSLNLGLSCDATSRIHLRTIYRYNLAMFQIIRPGAVADVVVIGSGAGGGTVTKVLADLGVNVTLLEAGPMLDPARDFKEHMWPHQVPHRGAGEGGGYYFDRGRPFGWFSAHAG